MGRAESLQRLFEHVLAKHGSAEKLFSALECVCLLSPSPLTLRLSLSRPVSLSVRLWRITTAP